MAWVVTVSRTALQARDPSRAARRRQSAAALASCAMAAPGCSLHLLDLSPDLLYRMFGHLSLPERLRLSLVCRRLRQLCAGASELWRHLDARTQAGQPASSVGDVVTQILSGVYKFSE